MAMHDESQRLIQGNASVASNNIKQPVDMQSDATSMMYGDDSSSSSSGDSDTSAVTYNKEKGLTSKATTSDLD